MLDKQSTSTEPAPVWRLLRFFGLENPQDKESPTAKNRPPKEPEERKHQFAVWYFFAAFLGVMLIQYLWVQYTQIETIPYSQFEQESNFVAKPHELFGQTRNYPFGASVETARNALHEWSDLCDFHDDLYFSCVNANVLFLRKCERARCKQVPVCRREQRARRDPPLRLATLRFEFPVSEFSADDPYSLALLAAVEQNLCSRASRAV